MKEWFNKFGILVWFSMLPILSSVLIAGYLSSFDFQIEWSLWNVSLLFLVSTLFMSLAIVPTTVTAIAFGFAFGWKSFPILIAAYILASIIGKILGELTDRKFWIDLIKKLKKGENIMQVMGDKSPLFVFSCRLSPVLPFGITNIFFGILRVNWKDFLLFGTLGMLPRTLLSFWVGTQALDFSNAIHSGDQFPWMKLIVIGLIFISFGLMVKVFSSIFKSES